MPDRLTQLLARVAGAALRLAPARFRATYQAEFTGSFASMLEDERRRRGLAAMLVLWIRGFVDAIDAAGRERRVDPGRRRPLGDLRGDVRAGVRTWRRAPGLSLTITLTLALGLGLASAIFAFADGYLFRPLPFPQGDRLFFVRDPDARVASALTTSEVLALRQTSVADLGFVEWGGQTPVPGVGTLQIGDRPVPVFIEGISKGFGQVIQVPLALGRLFTDDDYRGISPTPVWLNYRFWQREFGGDPDVLGRTYPIIGGARDGAIVVVGVLDRRVTAFDLNNEPPQMVAPNMDLKNRGPNLLSFPIVRLPAGMSVPQAQAAIGAALQAVAPAAPGRTRAVRLASLYEYQVEGGRPTAEVFLTGAILVLALVTINLTHLLLARAAARTAEVATRAALGASRWRIVRTFLVETLLLGALGIAGGLLFGAWLSSVIAATVPGYPSGGRNLALVPMAFDARVTVVAIVVGVIISLCGVVWPAWHATRRPLRAITRRSAASGGEISTRVSRVILASEVAVATIIMAGTMFMSVGIWRYLNQPFGFDITDRFRVYLEPPVRGAVGLGANWGPIVDVVRDASGVRAAGVARDRSTGPIVVDEQELPSRDVRAADVGYGYFEAWGALPIAGRTFTGDEVAGDAPVAVVDQKFAAHVWPGGNPIGRRVRIGIGSGPPREVIGVVRHERRRLSVETAGVVYVPRPKIDQRETMIVWAPGLTAGDLEQRLVAPVGEAVPGFKPVVTPVTFENLFVRDVGEAYFQRPVVIVFGLFAFVLAGVGLFGLVAYLVEQRTREYAIRIALGARATAIWRHVVGQSVAPTAAGLVAGLGGAWALEGLARAGVFGWQSSGPMTVAAVSILLISVAAVAATIPARRALRIDPIQALRSE